MAEGVVAIAEKVRRGEATAEQVTAEALERIGMRNAALNAFLYVARDQALEQARGVDARRARGEPLGPLAGVPVAVKDAICTRGVRSTAGSKILGSYVPPYDATVIERLRAADAILVGKTNMDEFAMGSSTENSAFGPAKNPWDTTRTPGGWSGGSASAVAARLAPCALGSDTGGSIRQPASLTGTVGLKPTYGRVSRYGLIAFASSLDQIGPIGKTVEDCAVVYEAIAGVDRFDATTVDRPVERSQALADLKGLRVGIVREFALDALEGSVRAVYEAAYRDLENLGAELVEVELPTADYGVATYYLIAPAECSSNLARFDGMRYGLRVEGADVGATYEATRAAGFGDEVKRRILIGTYALSSGYYDAYYVRAQKARTLIAGDFARAFERCDVIACPAASSPAFEFNAKSDPVSMYLMDYYTIPMSLAGLPSLSLPCGYVTAPGGEHPLPLGLELTAPLFADARLLGVAAAYEGATEHLARHAPAPR